MSGRDAELGRAVARDLLAAGAVLLRPDEPFTWASGIRAPIYCDNRVTLSLPEVRERITDALASTVRAAGIEPAVVAGVATAGIPQATLLADRLGLPLVYVRAEAKRHGRRGRIEGRLEGGVRVLVVEDLISTGGSSLAAVEVLREAGADVRAVLAVFSYGLPAAETAFREACAELHVVATLEDLLEEATLADEETAAVREWRADPEGWGGGRAEG